jgi:hypothetical protein
MVAAAVAAADAQAEVAAIMAAAETARAEAIAEANRQARAAVAQAQAEAAQIVASAVDDDSRSEPTIPSATTAVSALSTTPLLPDGKHAFLSYQWDVQTQVVQIKELLNERNVKCWMDIDGGMKTDIYDSVSIIFAHTTPNFNFPLPLATHTLASHCSHPSSIHPQTDGRGSARCGMRRLFHDSSVPGLRKLQFGAQVCATVRCADCASHDATKLYGPEVARYLDGWQYLDPYVRQCIGC